MDARSLLLDRVPGLGRFRGDIMGGLISAGVAIPLAMGYGMFGFVVLGNDYFIDGARAGLLTAVVVGIACVVLGDKSANVYAPREIGRASCRERSVDLGGWRIIKKKREQS